MKDHFEEILDMVKIGSGAARKIEDVKLSRYACYLIVQNASPDKEVVALGQTYFAVQTRLQEIQQMDAYNHLNSEDEKRLFLRKEMASHNKQLADAARNAGGNSTDGLCRVSKSWVHGLVWGIGCQRHT